MFDYMQTWRALIFRFYTDEGLILFRISGTGKLYLMLPNRKPKPGYFFFFGQIQTVLPEQ